jgi:negative regulator of flagellin synthesis FlgM
MRVSQTGTNSTQAAEASAAKQNGKTAKAQQNKSAAVDPGAVKSDISSRGREAARAKAIANAAPDVREEKIAELKQKIAAGKYRVNPEAIADRMVDEHLAMSGKD